MNEERLHLHINASFQDGIDHALQHIKNRAWNIKESGGELGNLIDELEKLQEQRRNQKA